MTAGWVIFQATTLSEALHLLAVMAGLRGGEGGHLTMVTPEAAGTLIIAAGIVIAAPNTWQMRFPRTRLAAVALAALLLLCVLRIAAPSPFVYFQF